MTNELKYIIKGLLWCVFIALAVHGATMAIYFA